MFETYTFQISKCGSPIFKSEAEAHVLAITMFSSIFQFNFQIFWQYLSINAISTIISSDLKTVGTMFNMISKTKTILSQLVQKKSSPWFSYQVSLLTDGCHISPLYR